MGQHGHRPGLLRSRERGADKKLIWAGRAWVKGNLIEGGRSELLEDAAQWNIPPEALPTEADEDDWGIWPENVPAVEAFLAVCGQWRVIQIGEAPHFLGLDYAAVRAGLALSRKQMTPELWEQVRLVEAGARDARNGIEERIE